MRELVKPSGAYECFVKYHTSGVDLDRPIQRAIAFVEQIPKDPYRPR